MRTIAFEVELNMFAQGKIRKVRVPKYEIHDFWSKRDFDTNEILDAVFKYGQNDFQPQKLPSVSMGDVIRFKGDRYLILSVGFRKLGEGDITVGIIPPTKE